MLNTVRGQRPDLTPAQVAGALIAGVPIVSNLLHVFGVYDLSQDQEDALKDTLTWGGILAGLLIFGDAGLRTARNRADAHVHAAALQAGTEPHDVTLGGPDDDVTVASIPDEGLPTDEEEDAAPPPDDLGVLDEVGADEPNVLQPSQTALT
ncbi:MAG TPA: hypothetical protein VF520_13445 [Thermoleophilaceae bacterium]|jgi:hypothetical protein